MHRRFFAVFLATATLLTACASAGDRLNEGMQLQSEGRYMEAAYRYADAVDKDGTLEEARERLTEVADSALRRTMDSADDHDVGGDPIAAGDAFCAGTGSYAESTRSESGSPHPKATTPNAARRSMARSRR